MGWIQIKGPKCATQDASLRHSNNSSDWLLVQDQFNQTRARETIDLH